MADITLITGGCRSGKSSHALRLAEDLPGPRLYVATCPPVDDEMEARILKHRDARDPARWDTVEETLDIASVLRTPPRPSPQRGGREYGVFLVDCMALWVNNLMYETEDLAEDRVAKSCRELISACDDLNASVIFVTNEVGMGIVPDNAVARRYRDLLGRCNQVLAAKAQTVILMACGLPLILKKDNRYVPA